MEEKSFSATDINPGSDVDGIAASIVDLLKGKSLSEAALILKTASLYLDSRAIIQ